MFYLYHKVPENGVRGNVLYPLSTLKVLFPDIYKAEVAKYKGREEDMQKFIPVLNCMWNDVLHLSPISPAEICKALIAAGRKDQFSFTCFKIGAEKINASNAVIYLFSHPSNGVIDNKEIVPYQIDQLDEYKNITDLARDHYLQRLSVQKRVLLHYGLPHVLYKGNIDITSTAVETVYSSEF